MAGSSDSTAHSLDLIALGVCTVLLLASFVYARDRGRTRLLSYGVWASLAILVTGLILPYVIGGLGDLAHVRCAGFFGVQESCIQNFQLEFIGLTTFFPYLLVSIPIALVILISLLLGIGKSLTRHHV